jgi:hypothetical protein
MNFIKRAKGGAIHYAAKVNKQGCVTGWTLDRQQAKLFTEEQSFAVETFYDDLPASQKANAGTIEPVEVKPVAIADEEVDE